MVARWHIFRTFFGNLAYLKGQWHIFFVSGMSGIFGIFLAYLEIRLPFWTFVCSEAGPFNSTPGIESRTGQWPSCSESGRIPPICLKSLETLESGPRPKQEIGELDEIWQLQTCSSMPIRRKPTGSPTCSTTCSARHHRRRLHSHR